MKTVALLPLVALLSALAEALPDHSNAAELARRINPRRHHSAEVERMIEEIKRRDIEAKAASHQVAKRQVRTRGQTCRPRNQVAVATPSASPSSTTTSSSSTTSSTAAPTTTQDQAAVAPTAAPTTASPSPAASPAATQAAAPASGNSNKGQNWGQLTPNGKKAGMSAGDSVNDLKQYLGWYYNWAPTEPWPKDGAVAFVPTLWGGGSADSTDAARLVDFKAMTSVPTWIIGPNEPDCAAGGQMSAGMSIDATAALWNQLMVPKGNAGSLLLSPSMCKQMNEDGWLGQFQQKISRDWDITSIHINKNNMDGVRADIDYYWNTYKKPIWVSEFACVNDSPNFVPCTDQGQINQFIHDIVDVLENDSRVYAYAYSNGNGLGNVWPSWGGNGLSASGQAYKDALSKYYH